MRKFFHLLLAITLPYMAHGAPPTETRAWKSTAGTTLQAKANSIEDGTVIFEGAGGKIIKVPLDKLAAEDRKVLQDHFDVKDAPAGIAAKLAHPSGTTTGPIDAGGSKYYVYLPKSLQAGGKYPMLFYTGSGGGDPGTLEQLKEGAEICGWIVACSVESSNQGTDNLTHAKRCVAHLQKSLPLDPKRIYFSGNSGGAREAFLNSSELEGAGVLAQIAGAKPEELKKGCHYFFISGGYDYNRYGTSFSYAAVKRNAAIRFHADGHNNGPGWMMTEGMVWLEAQWQRKVKDTGASRARYETAALEWIANLKTTANHRAAWWASFFTSGGMLPANQSKLAALQSELSTKPTNVAYIKGIADIEKLASDVLAEGPRYSPDCMEHTSPEIQKAADKLLAEHASTPWIKDVLEGIKKKTDRG